MWTGVNTKNLSALRFINNCFLKSVVKVLTLEWNNLLWTKYKMFWTVSRNTAFKKKLAFSG